MAPSTGTCGMIAPTTRRPLPRKPPVKRLFSGVAGSPLSTITAEPARKRGRPAKYAAPEQRNKAAADALRKKRDEEKQKQEINEIVKTSENVDDKHLFIVGAG